MNLNILSDLELRKREGRKSLAVLLDPDLHKSQQADELISRAVSANVDYFFLGGSLVSDDRMGQLIESIRKYSDIPAVIFPGSAYQIHRSADAFLLLSLASGRNPDFLIGRHVEAAPLLKASGLEIIPTGYILVDGGRHSSTAYLTHTQVMPSDREDLAAATALACQQLGMRLIYLEAGSGALYPVPEKMTSFVGKTVQLPLVVGGGIRSGVQASGLYHAGADLLVVGNALETNPALVIELTGSRDAVNLKAVQKL
jgi:geranylgeranylglyceryl phosphate synthase family protein